MRWPIVAVSLVATGAYADQPAAKVFKPWVDLGAVATALDGAWVVAGGVSGGAEAWNIHGNTVTVWDGRNENTYDASLLAPCWLELKITAPNGDVTKSTFTFHTTRDRFYLGPAGALYSGNTAIVCSKRSIYVWDGTRCMRWTPIRDQATFEGPAKCLFTITRDAIEVGDDKWSIQSGVVTNASARLANLAARRYTSFAGAKRALGAKR